MKRNLLLALGISVLLFTTMACSVTIPRNVSVGMIRGSGDIVERTFDVSGFDRITLAGSGNLHVETGDSESLVVEGDDNIIDLLDIDVKGDELMIGFRPGTRIDPSTDLEFFVTVEDLSAVRLLGSGDIEIAPLETNDLNVAIAGSGDVYIADLTADRFNVEIPGSGRVEVAGVVREQSITILGSGNYDAGNLMTETTSVSIAGSATVTVAASEHLSVNIAGNGTVRYSGDPEVERIILGSGDIQKID